ncbi:MAG: hypothetical protein ABFE07_20560 [Armatimonadia bacterium]
MNKSGCDGDVQAHAKARRPSAQASSLSAPRRLVNTRTHSISDIKARLGPHHILAICKDWLSHGSRQGDWWVCTTPWRDDTKPSLGVSLSSGRWSDFATGEKGDMIDLSMRLFGDNLRDTIDGFAEMLGLKDA